MGSFNDIAAGPRHRLPAVLPLPGARFNIEKNAWEGPHAPLDVITLEEDAYTEVLKDARAFAIRKGIPDPKLGDEIYDRAVMVETIARACVDQSDKENDTPFFPGGAEQIRGARVMTPEVVAYLYGVQKHHQDAVNPLAKDLSPAEYMVAVFHTAGGDPSFFLSSRPGTQWSFLLTLVRQQISSTTRALVSGGASGAADAKSES